MFGKCVLFLTLFSLMASCPVQCFAEDMQLFNDEETLQLNYPVDEWQKEIAGYREFQRNYQVKAPMGPIISVVNPEVVNDTYISSIPLALLVHLKHRLAPINLESLKVKGKRGFFSLDITDRIRPFLRQPENDEDADFVIDAKVPKIKSGNYEIILEIEDVKGNMEKMTAFLEVKKQ